MGMIAIVGGTGPEGIGLGLRFAQAGEHVRLGSRQAARAVDAARQATATLRAAGLPMALSGHENGDAIAGADLVVLALPYPAVHTLLPALAPRLAGRIVLDVVNPVMREGGRFHLRPLDAGSAGEEIQALLPGAAVVSAFKNESAEELGDLSRPLRGDVLACSDHQAARERVLALTERMPALRGIDAGPLASAGSIEAITVLLLNLNRRYKAVTSIRILGLTPGPRAGT